MSAQPQNQWIQCIDARTGRPILFNPATGQFSQIPQQQPQKPAQPPKPAQLPPGGRYEERIDPATGNTYYLDHLTKTTSWQRPPDYVPPAAPVLSSSARSAPQPQQPQQPVNPFMASSPGTVAGRMPQPVVYTQPPPASPSVPVAYSPYAQRPAAAPAGFVVAPADGPLSTSTSQNGRLESKGFPGCAHCGEQFGLLSKRRVECTCCLRTFCNDCLKDTFETRPGHKDYVCRSCRTHYNRSDQRCLSRVVSTLLVAQFKAVRGKALREMLELRGNPYSPEDFYEAGVVRSIVNMILVQPAAGTPAATAGVFDPAPPAEVVQLSIAVLAFTFSACMPAVNQIAANKPAFDRLAGFIKDAIDKDSNLASIAASFAANESTSKMLMEKNILPTIQKGLTSNDPECVRHSARAACSVCQLEVTLEGKPPAQGSKPFKSDAEGEALIMYAFVNVLQNNGDKDTVLNIIRSVQFLCSSGANSKENSLAFVSADGIPALFSALDTAAASSTQDLIEAALDILLSLSSSSLPSVGKYAPRLVGLCASLQKAHADASFGKALVLLASICENSETVKEAGRDLYMPPERAMVITTGFSSPDPRVRAACTSIACSVMSGPEGGEAAQLLFQLRKDESGPEPILRDTDATRAVVAGIESALASLQAPGKPDPCCLMAVRVVGIAASRLGPASECVFCSPSLMSPLVVAAASSDISIAVECLTALWAVAGSSPALATLISVHPQIFDALTRPFKTAASNPAETPESARHTSLVCNLAAALVSSTTSSSFPNALQENRFPAAVVFALSCGEISVLLPALEALSAIAASDPQIGAAVAEVQGLPALIARLLKAPSAEVCSRAAAAAADFSRLSDSFRPAFAQAGGLAGLMTLSTMQENPTARERAMMCLAVFSAKSDVDRSAVVQAGAVPMLVDAIFSAPKEAKIHAIAALGFLAQSGKREYLDAIASGGGVMALCGVLTDNPEEIVCTAAGTLSRLFAVSLECRRSGVENSVVKMAAEMVSSSNENIQSAGFDMLHVLLTTAPSPLVDSGDSSAAAEISETLIPILSAHLDNPATSERASFILLSLSSQSPAALESYVAANGPAALTSLLALPSPPSAALLLLEKYCTGNGIPDDDMRDATLVRFHASLLSSEGENAPINAILALLHRDDPALQKMGLRCLSGLAEDPRAKPILISSGAIVACADLSSSSQDPEIIGSAVHVIILLSVSEDSMDISALSTLAKSNSALSAIVSAISSPATPKKDVDSMLRMLDAVLRSPSISGSLSPEFRSSLHKVCLPQIISRFILDPELSPSALPVLAVILSSTCPPYSKEDVHSSLSALVAPENYRVLGFLFALVTPGGPLLSLALETLVTLVALGPLFANAAGTIANPDTLAKLAFGSPELLPEDSNAARVILCTIARDSAPFRTALAEHIDPSVLLADVSAAELAADLTADPEFRNKAAADASRWITAARDNIEAFLPAVSHLVINRSFRSAVAEDTQLVEAIKTTCRSGGNGVNFALRTAMLTGLLSKQEDIEAVLAAASENKINGEGALVVVQAVARLSSSEQTEMFTVNQPALAAFCKLAVDLVASGNRNCGIAFAVLDNLILDNDMQSAIAELIKRDAIQRHIKDGLEHDYYIASFLEIMQYN